MSTSRILSIKVTYPDQFLEPSTFDLQFLGASDFGSGYYDAWCADADIPLDVVGPVNGVYSLTLKAGLYSSYDYGAIPAAFQSIELPGHLDEANWLLNQHFTVGASPYTTNEVQAALWTLLGDQDRVATLLPGTDATRVQTLVDLALQNDGFAPDITDDNPNNDEIGLLLDLWKDSNNNGVRDANEVVQQPLIVMVKSAALGDRVWHDVNADGIQNVGGDGAYTEQGIAGAVVRLVRDRDGDGAFTSAGEVLATTTTDADGNYVFKGLAPGLDYQVQFFTPTGFDAASPRQQGASNAADSDGALSDVVVLSAGEWNKTIDAGFYKPVSVGDFVWNDQDADGIQDVGEAGIGGVRLTLTGTTGSGEVIVRNTLTAADGSYLFDALPPGIYQVSVDADNFDPAGALSGFQSSPIGQGTDAALDSNASPTGTDPVTLLSGQSDTDLDFGYFKATAAIGDRVWEDTNANGQQDDGETGIADATVRLYTCVDGAPGTLVATTTTDASGNYAFTGLVPGQYIVAFETPAGYQLSTADVGADASDSDAGTGGLTGCYTLASGETNNTVDAGFWRPAAIGDRVWLDANANGQQDDGEAGVEGVEVELYTCVDGAPGVKVGASTFTDAAGNYAFTGLMPGQYVVKFLTPDGFSLSPVDVGGDGSDSDAGMGGFTGCYTLTSGQTNNTVDAGLYQGAAIGDRVWEDTNANGQQDDGEAGVEGVEVELYTCVDGAPGVKVGASTFTDAAGNYAFTGLMPGQYVVKFLTPDGFSLSPVDVGGDGSDSDAGMGGFTGCYTLTSGQTNNTVDAGLYQGAAIGDRVWEDTNANGQQDDGETGIADATVRLYTCVDGAPGTLVATTTTDASGNYAFTGLVPGQYIVAFETPAGYQLSTADVGADASDSDAGTGGLTGCYTLASGETNNTVDAGFWRPAAIGDRVWLDANANGQQDDGEAGVEGVEVELYTCVDGAPGVKVGASTFTDAAGNYAFTGLMPGQYVVKFLTPDGFSLSPVDVGGDGSDSDAGMGGFTGCYTLTSGQTNNTVDAGLYQGAAIGDRVWEDTNANGQQDDGETGIADATVRLYTCVDGAPGTLVATTTTDASGNYAFTGLVPGQYIVAFETPTGYQLSTADVGADASDSDAGTGGLTGCYTLASGETNNTVDAGFWRPAAIGDRVWLDANANGQQDDGEAGVEGVEVELYTCVDGAPGVKVGASTFTDAAGNYAFTGLMPGQYVVKFLTPDGFSLSPVDVGGDGSDSDAGMGGFTGCYTLASGQTNNTVDAGLYQGAAIGDRVWEDTNANGQQDDGENGIADATVRLYTCVDGAPGTLVATTTTDASGNYAFTGLVPGQYIVAFETPAGYQLSTADVGADASDSDAGTGGLTGCYTLASGETNNTVDAGFWRPAAIGDRVWLDANANGQQDDGEAGVEGVEVELYTCVDGAPGVKVGASTFTDAAGNYAFTGLMPGQYVVKFLTPDGFSLSPVDVGGDGSDSDAGMGGFTGCYTLTSGQTNNTVDAGLYQGAAIGDRVWEDTNANGQQDDGENGIADATVRLYTCVDGAPGTLVATTTTDASGNYAFTGLVPGQYIVAFETPAGYQLSTADVGADASDSDAGTGGLTGCYTLASGETNNTVDAGFWRPAAIGDRVWLDANANGQQDDGEAGVEGVEVELYTCVDGAPGVKVGASTFTDAAGNYAFTGLMPGQYVVKFLTPDGFSLSPVDVGGDGSDSDAGMGGFTGCYTLTSGQTNNTVDAGLYQGAAIGDRVWEDTNANGQQDDGETGIADATVRLYTCVDGAPGTLVATTTTDASGNYAFTGLVPGQYIVAFETPAGYQLSTADVGADASDSDAGTGGLTGCYTLASGETNNTVDAGFYQPAAIGDRVWLDANANGQQDDGEAGVEGVEVELYTCVDGAPGVKVGASTFTDAAGNYSFTGLEPGDYLVKFITPTGFFLTNQNVGANDTADSDADATTGFTGCYKLEAGETDSTADAGIFKPGEGGVVASIDLVKLTNGTDNNAPTGPYLAVGSTATFQYLVTNDGMVALSDIVLSDDHGTPGDTSDDFTPIFLGGDADGDGLLDVGESWIYEASTVVSAGQYTNLGAVTGTPVDADGNLVPSLPQPTDTDLDNHFGARVAIDIEKFVRGVHQDTGGGGEGLTPGFWKTHSEYGPAPLAGWPETGYSPDDAWEAVFGINVPGAPTLLDALNAAGGGLDALLRHSSAALLNAAQPNVDYAYTSSQVISLTRDAILSGDLNQIESVKNQFVMQNELGADLSTPASGGATVTTPWFDADAPGTGPFIALGGTAEFRYEVRNTGDVALEGVSVSDDRLSGLSFEGGDTDHDGLLDLDEVWVYRGSELADTAGVDIANVGTATGSALGIMATDADAARYSTAASTQSLGDFVWLDANRNGLQDGGEAGIGGMLVTLTGGGADGIINGVGDTTAITSTDVDGYYQFDNLAAGVQYQVTFGKPAGTAFTMRDAGADDAIDSDAGADGKSQIVTLSPGQHNPSVDAGEYVLNPGIDLEKTTSGPSNANPTAADYDNEDTPDGAGVPVLTAGSAVTWTYKLTNTGNVDFAKADLALVDDNGTPTNAADDMSIANGKIAYVSGDDGDNVLEAGESWLYEAHGTVQSLGVLGAATTIDFSGNTAVDGTDGNTRSYSAGGVTVQANAWSRTKGSDTWQKAWLGAYDAGLGVTDSSESGSGSTHTVDNYGRDNYIVFQFSQDVVVDKAFLGYVVGDSDMTVYVGSSTAPITAMNNAVLAGMSLKEFNDTGSTSARWADFNAGDVQGNVLILAARDDGHSSDYFKVEKLVFEAVQSGGVYANTATVTAPGGLSDSDMSHYETVPATPGIDLEKTTSGPSNANPTAADYDNEDTPDGAGVPVLTAGSAVTWTYKLTNTGNVDFAKADLALVDDNGTPTNAADDMSIANGKIAYVSGDDGDNVLEAGESWLYEAHGTVQSLGALGAATTIDFSGNTAVDGTDGNTRSYSAGGVTVQANAWSRTKGSDTWQKAWLGAYDAGLGVTDSSESGSGSTHTVDNYGRDNYIVFQFSQDVVVDKAFLGYVVGDSDMTVYVGSSTAPITAMNNAVLAGMSLKEFNDTGSTSARWADFNAGDVQGNVLILAARDDGHSSDYFKVEKLVFEAVQSGGVYANTATVTAPGGLSDSDMSHYETVPATPGIDLEKTTSGPSNANPTAADYDNEDTPDGAGVPVLTAGSAVTWTYKLTNTGNVDFAKADLALVDDNGTPTNAADDMSIANGKIAYVSGDDGDNVLEAGESWLYEAHGTVQSLGVLGAATTIDFSGNTAVDGTDGNTRSYSAGGVTVQANAWSRTKGSDTWQKAWLGAYDAGLGVTDSSESGSGSTHTVDNYGRDNYIVFQFSQDVVVDKAFLGYVVGDSDMTVYVGSSTAPITAMNNAVLAGMSLKEFNDTGSTSARWADFNAGDVQGNVLILAARDDGHSSDYFKVEKLVFEAVQSGGVYANTATVTAPGGLSDSDMSHYETVPATPGIDLEKTTSGPSNANPTAADYDNEDTPDGAGVPVLTAGSAVTWTYKLTNTGNVDFAKADLALVDDNGTPTNAADDMSIANGKIAYVSGDDGDNVLEAGESWLYEAHGTVQSLGALGAATTIDFSGNTAVDGTDGNTRSYSAGGVTVQANAWSRTKGSDTWQKAWLGAYDAGLGVTDSSESGSGSTHTVDNYGRDNYIVFQFSQDVVVDKAFLGYVVGDSDMTVYVGSSTAPITAMNNAVLAGMSLKEFNDTGSTSARWADFNAGDVQGNVLILAARDDGHSSDYFKVEKLVFEAVQSGGVYANTATVTAPGGLSDSDMSHYESAAKIVAAPKFFVVDQAKDLSYQYADGGDGLGSFALANTDPRDIAANADGSLLWVLDRDKNVEVYKGDGTQLGQWKAYGLGTEPEGITLDGKDLWMADRTGKLNWYDNAATRTSGTDSPELSFTLSLDGNLKGIVTDGTYLWAVTEGTCDYVYRFKIVRDWWGNPSGLSQSGGWQLPTANTKPTGITLDPSGKSDSLWIVDESTDTVYEYGYGRSQTWGVGTITAKFKLSAGNTAPQGIADPLPAGAEAFDLAEISAAAGLETTQPDPYAGDFVTPLFDDAIAFHDAGIVGTSAQSEATLALLHA